MKTLIVALLVLPSFAQQLATLGNSENEQALGTLLADEIRRRSTFALELAARAGYDVAGCRRYIARTQPPDARVSPVPGRELRLARMDELLAGLATGASSPQQEF